MCTSRILQKHFESLTVLKEGIPSFLVSLVRQVYAFSVCEKAELFISCTFLGPSICNIQAVEMTKKLLLTASGCWKWSSGASG